MLFRSIVVGANFAAESDAKNFNALQERGTFTIAQNAFIGPDWWGNSETLEQMNYRTQDGEFSVGDTMFVGYTSAGAFYQDGGEVSVTNNLLLGLNRADRTYANRTNAPALYRIENNGTLSVGGKLQVGGVIDRDCNHDAIFEVVGDNTITVGSFELRKHVSPSPRQAGKLKIHIDKSGAFTPIHVNGNIRFDAGTQVFPEAENGGIPVGEYTLITYEGTLTDYGLELAPETNDIIWKRFRVNPQEKTVTVRYAPYPSWIIIN